MSLQSFFPEDLTPRALIGGIIVGTLLCCTNLYLGLQSAFITMASMQAALVGYGLLSIVSRGPATRQRRQDGMHNQDDESGQGRNDEDGEGNEQSLHRRRGLLAPFSAQENAVLQATAVSLGSMPLSAGLIGIVPAFNLLKPEKDGSNVYPFSFGWTSLVLWCASMAFFGIFFASPMRPSMIVREKLQFPSGSATAQLIALLHGETLRDDGHSDKQHELDAEGSDTSNDSYNYAPAHAESPNYTHTRSSADETRPLLRRSETERERSVEAKSGWRTISTTFAASSAIALASFAFPVVYALPIFDPFVPCHDAAAKWGWYATPSLSYVGQGIIMGPQTTISMFAGAIVGWAILSPFVQYMGWTNGVPTDAEGGSQAWTLWVALAIMTSESIVGLAMLSVTHRRHSTSTIAEQSEMPSSKEFEPSQRLTPTSWIIGGIAVSGAIASLILLSLFRDHDLQPWVPPIGIVLAGLLSILAVRALGATDLNPVNALGKLSQLALAVLQPGNVVANMVGGALAEAGAMQAGELMQDYKTGHLLGASPRGQFFGQVIGSTAGIFVASTTYKLYERAYTLPGPDMPAPAARLWLNFARLINNGSLPPYSGTAMIIAGLLFAVTTLLRSSIEAMPAAARQRHPRLAFVRWLPNGVAFAVGLGLNTPNYSLARLVGGLVVLHVRRREERRVAQRRSIAQSAHTAVNSGPDQGASGATSSNRSNSLPPITLLIWSAGFVLGEGFASIVLLFLKEAGLGPISCWGCRGGCSGGC